MSKQLFALDKKKKKSSKNVDLILSGYYSGMIPSMNTQNNVWVGSMSFVSTEVKMFLLAPSSGEMMTFNSKHMLSWFVLEGGGYPLAEC